jgi:glycosyltransferase involved in cell wall biosynthesis
MNILLIDHYAGSDRHGMEYRPFYLAREWIRLGHQVTIAAASVSHLRIQAPRIEGEVTEEEIDGIRYVWLRTPEYSGNGMGRVRNILAFLTQLMRHRARFVQDYRPDVVIASSTYPLDTLPGCYFARKSGAKFVFEVHDLWPLSLVELAGMSRWHPFIMLLQWVEDFAYRKSDHVISMLPKADSYMKKHGMAAHKFAYLPNGLHLAEWEGEPLPLPPEHRETLAGLKAEGRFLVGYAGAHGLANALPTLVEAAQLMQSQPAAFVLVGQGPDKNRLQGQVREAGLTNVTFLPPVPKRLIPSLLAAMDALYIGWIRNPIYRFGISPNKLIDYMMAGNPVIHAVEAGNDIVAESRCGLSIPPEDPSAIARAIAQLMELPRTEREAMGRRGREYVLAEHDYQVLAQRFLAIIRQHGAGSDGIPHPLDTRASQLR